jgi:hypothetical protein
MKQEQTKEKTRVNKSNQEQARIDKSSKMKNKAR